MRIIPSIASAGMLNIESTLKKLGEAGALHIDIEDGNFKRNQQSYKAVLKCTFNGNKSIGIHKTPGRMRSKGGCFSSGKQPLSFRGNQGNKKI